MASSSTTGAKAELKFDLPSDYTEEKERSARAYWGDKLVPENAVNPLNPRLSSLVVAICDFANAITPHQTPEISDHAQAIAYLMPESFATVLDLFRIGDPEFGPPEHVKLYGPSMYDSIFTAYYTAFNMSMAMATRPNSGKPGNLPMLPRKMVHFWLQMYISSCPDEFWVRLNVILRDIPSLLDPITESPFEEKIIPRSCFPKQPVRDDLDFLVQAVEAYNVESIKITDAAKPLTSSQNSTQLAQQDYQNALEEARLVKEMSRNANGGWKRDENGNETYVEGWVW